MTARAEMGFSSDGNLLAMSADDERGVRVLDLRTGMLSTLTDSPSSGHAFSWSPDGTRLGFKILHPHGDGFLQEPAVYDATTGVVQSLAAPSSLAGVPSFSAQGHVAFTLGHEAVVIDDNGFVTRHTLPQYVNLVALSPDGKQLVFNASDDSIWLLDRQSDQRRQIAQGPSYGPVWSSDGRRILLSGVDGNVSCVDLERQTVHRLGRGTSPSWLADGQHIIFTELPVPKGDGQPPQTTVQTVRFDGTERRMLPGVQGYDTRLSPNDTTIVFRSAPQTEPFIARSWNGSTSFSAARPLSEKVKSHRDLRALLRPARPNVVPPPVTGWRQKPVKIDDVPYLHQVYDTPNHFNGHWACNATSAIMTLAYYGVIDFWDTTVNVPSSHVSHYGNYVSEIYTINGKTFDIGSPDPNGNLGYGGYGYIVRNDWKDTKGYMADYIGFHGVDSGVDWSPNWDKVIKEVDNKHPFVVLTSITSAGHYIVDIGYHSDQHTAIFNDPYGNKNSGYMNYSGANALYDWPGYNNGYSNLVTVHCFIWSRSTVQQPEPEEPDAGTEDVEQPEPDAAEPEASKPDVAIEDSSKPEIGSSSDAGLEASETDARKPTGGSSAFGYSEEPDACACSWVGAHKTQEHAYWSLLACLSLWVLRRRGS
jgi:WD40 repeat protein